MILKTDFRDSGAESLIDYIQRDRSQDSGTAVELKNPSGHRLSEQEVEQFVDKTREFQFQRHLIISPDPDGSYSPGEVSENTREFMNRQFASEPTTDYVYAVHRDTEFPHAHIAATGEQAELEMDREEIQRLRDRAATIYNEPQRTKEPIEGERDAEQPVGRVPDRETRDQYHERELELKDQPEKELHRSTERSKEPTPTAPSSESERDRNSSEQRQVERGADRESEPASESGSERASEPDRQPEPEPERDFDRLMGG